MENEFKISKDFRLKRPKSAKEDIYILNPHLDILQ